MSGESLKPALALTKPRKRTNTAPAPTSGRSGDPDAIAPYSFTLDGAPFSGTNSKRIVRFGKKVALIKSAAAIEWQAEMTAQLSRQYDGAPMQHAVCVALDVFRARKTGDLDNFAKPVLDALQASGVLANDSQVVELRMYRHDDKTRPRVEITITQHAA